MLFIFSIFLKFNFADVITLSVTFFFLSLFFSQYVSLSWSIFIALISCSSALDLPFHQYVINMVTVRVSQPKSWQILLLLQPAISLSLILYSASIFLLSRSNFSSFVFYTGGTFLLSIFVYLFPADFIYALTFLSVNSIYTLWKTYLFKLTYLLYFLCALACLIFSYCITPQVGIEFLLENASPKFACAFYLSIPISLMVIVFFSLKVDFFEVLYRFRVIYAFLLIESISIIYSYFWGQNIISSPVAVYLNHFLYYLPPLYYLQREARQNSTISNLLYFFLGIIACFSVLYFICITVS